MKLPTIKTKHFVFHPHSYGIATLMRIGFRFKGRQLLLHHFRPHEESEFHDHPWSFRTRVLWGSYLDVSLGPVIGQHRDTALTQEWSPVYRLNVDYLRRGATRFRPAHHAHRTSSEGHVWTLVLTGPSEREWCKGTPESWVCGGQVVDFDATRGMVKIDEGP